MDIDAMGYKIRDLLIANQQLTVQVAELRAFQDRFKPMLEEAEAHYLASRPQATEQPQTGQQQQDQADGQKSEGDAADQQEGEQQQSESGEQSSANSANSAGEPQDTPDSSAAATPPDNTGEAGPGEPQATEQP